MLQADAQGASSCCCWPDSADLVRDAAPQVGVQRSNFTGLFSYLTGAAAPQVASESPYAHWGWKQQALAAVQGYNCTLAWKDMAYGRCGMHTGAGLQATVCNGWLQRHAGHPEAAGPLL
jgi:hypothetical protein